MAAITVATCAACSGVKAPRIEHLIAQGAPVVVLALEHAQAVANLSDELLGRDGKAERFARYDLPELFGANLTLRDQGGLVDQARLLPALVMPRRIQGVREFFLRQAQDALGTEMFLGWKLESGN